MVKILLYVCVCARVHYGLCVEIVFPVPLLWGSYFDAYFPGICGSQKVIMCGVTSGHTISLVDVPIFIPIPYWVFFFFHYGFLVHFEVRYCDTFSMVLSNQTSLGYFTVFCDYICILELKKIT